MKKKAVITSAARDLLLLFIVALAIPSARAATATPVTVSTIAVAGSTVTITTAAPHNLAVNQAGCMSGTLNFCATLATVPNATSFTFTLKPNTSVAACASACGTTVVPMPVIIVSQVTPDGQNFQNINGFYWLPMLNGLPGTGSAWTASTTPCSTPSTSSCTAGASTAQSNAIAQGYVKELPFVIPHLSNTFSNVQLQTLLAAQWTSEQANVQNNVQPAANIGVIYDRSGWGNQ